MYIRAAANPKHQRPQPQSVSGVSTGMDACMHAQATNSLLSSSVARPALSPLPPLTGSHDGFPLEPRGATTTSGSDTPSASSSSRPPPAAAHRHHSLSEEADVDAHIAGHVVGDLDQASYSQHLNTQRTPHPPRVHARVREGAWTDRRSQRRRRQWENKAGIKVTRCVSSTEYTGAGAIPSRHARANVVERCRGGGRSATCARKRGFGDTK